MVRLEMYEAGEREHLLNLPCPQFPSTPFSPPLSVGKARVCIISTAGLHPRETEPFALGDIGYRPIPKDIAPNDLVMSHISTNFDRTGYQRDLNTIFPLDRLKELAEQNRIDSVANYHYSFMGATDPTLMEQSARGLAPLLKQDQVNSVLLVPV
ncbi:MAG: selenoprotein B glycine/betaine/sarcosine/D-proline reductase [Desulfobulbaceae bacterium]|nr:MAG: selenoprotein B glycine/betaine/sarcosine/D-proline reductase [Desulfobulbaceae bacterium]